MTAARVLLIAALVIVPCGVAQAHVSERAYILLLPTHLYIVGGALVVALSFAVMALVPIAGLRALERVRFRLGRLPRRGAAVPSLCALAVAVALVVAGFTGSRDPLTNPLPMVVWSLWWVGLTFLHAVFGNLWAHLNPWRGAYHLLTLVPGLREWRDSPPLGYPRWAGHGPAIVVFLAFTWFELIHPAPLDPDLLASVVTAYLGATFVGMLLFGERAWLRYGEAFSVFFRIVSWLSPLDPEQRRESGAGRAPPALSLTLPGIRLLKVGALPLGAAAFVLLALASVSFDGLSRTFWWLDLIGVNPLEYPGRTDLIGANSLGLLGVFAALVAVYLAAVLLGHALVGRKDSAGGRLGLFVVSIVPIAFGYHFAHYLPAFLIDAQYAVRAISDPFALGWNLFGTGDRHVTASLLSNHRSVELIWNLQVVVIVVAHVVAVASAHFLSLRSTANLREAILVQAPMAALMIGYTLFGLWLLSTPAVG